MRHAGWVLFVASLAVSSEGRPDALVDLCQSVLDDASPDTPLVRAVGVGTLCYGGPINPEGVAEAIRLVEPWPPGQTINLVVRSLGGNVASAMDWMEFATRESRVVTTFAYKSCASSCANYWFLGAGTRHVLRDAIVLFHGGMTPGFRDRLEDQLREEAASRPPDRDRIAYLDQSIADFPVLMARERALLRKAGIDPDLLSLFDRPRDFSARGCRRNRRYQGIVLGPTFLAQEGIQVEQDLGPTSAEALSAVLKQRGGDPRSACWWDAAPLSLP